MAAHLTLIDHRPVNDYEAFFVDLMHGLDKYKIRSVAVVAVLEEPAANGGDAIVGYHAREKRDRQLAASLIEVVLRAANQKPQPAGGRLTMIQTDITYKIAQDAVRDMLGLTEPDVELRAANRKLFRLPVAA